MAQLYCTCYPPRVPPTSEAFDSGLPKIRLCVVENTHLYDLKHSRGDLYGSFITAVALLCGVTMVLVGIASVASAGPSLAAVIAAASTSGAQHSSELRGPTLPAVA